VTERDAYSRRISSEEAREGYILVLKSRLSSFPALGTGFELVEHGRPTRVRVESYPCSCRGPDLPHEHYFIRWKGLKPKDRVEIRKDPRKHGTYLIRVRD
jgi:hypothetical protein